MIEKSTKNFNKMSPKKMDFFKYLKILKFKTFSKINILIFKGKKEYIRFKIL